MNRKSWLIVTVVAVFMISPFLCPNSSYAVDSLAGRGSVGGQVNITHQKMEEAESDTRMIVASVGHFFTDNLEVNIAPMIMQMESDDFSATVYVVNGNVKYNFFQKGWTVVPYVGAQAGFAGYEADDADDNAFDYGVMAGVKFFVTEDMSLNIEINYIHTTFDELDVDQYTGLVGFAWYFGG